MADGDPVAARLSEWVLGLRDYVIAASAVAAAAAVTSAVPDLQHSNTFLLLITAVGAVSALYGLGPSLFATLLGTIVALCFLVPPIHSPSLSESPGARVATFMLLGAFISALNEKARRWRRQREWLLEREREARRAAEAAREALEVTEERLRLALHTAGMAAWDMDLITGRLVRIGASVDLKMPTSGPALDFLPLAHPEDRERLRAASAHALAGNAPLDQEFRVAMPDGTTSWIVVKGRAILDGTGKALRMTGVTMDITHRKHAEDALRESELRFRTMAQAVPGFIFTRNANGECSYVNPRFYEYTGMAPGTAEGLGWQAALHPEDVAHHNERWTNSDTTGAPFEHRYRLRAADGSYRWFIARAQPMRDGGGTIVRWFGSCTDIDDQVQAEEALRVSEARFRELAEAIPHMVWISPPDGSVEYANARWAEYLGPIVHTPVWSEALHDEDRERTLAAWQRALETGELYAIECRWKRWDGTFRWHLVRAIPVRDDAGRIVHWFGTCTDIDDQKRAEEALAEADRRKDVFLDALAHELESSLAPIRQALHVIDMSGHDPAAVARARELVEREMEGLVHVRRLGDRLDELLSLSRTGRREFRLRTEPVELSEVMRRAVQRARPFIDAADHHLTLAFFADDVHVEADVTSLAQAIMNLLDNAARYTPPGGSIWVETERLGDEVEIRVRDSGTGIAPELLPHVFDLFVRAEDSPGPFHERLGIGLAMVRRCVELHEGRVEVRSSGRGQGSEFVVRLPVWRPEKAFERRPVTLH